MISVIVEYRLPDEQNEEKRFDVYHVSDLLDIQNYYTGMYMTGDLEYLKYSIQFAERSIK